MNSEGFSQHLELIRFRYRHAAYQNHVEAIADIGWLLCEMDRRFDDAAQEKLPEDLELRVGDRVHVVPKGVSIAEELIRVDTYNAEIVNEANRVTSEQCREILKLQEEMRVATKAWREEEKTWRQIHHEQLIKIQQMQAGAEALLEKRNKHRA